MTGDVLRRILGSDSVYIADVAKDLRTLFPARSGREHEPAGDFLERHQETLLAAIRYWAKASDGRRLRAGGVGYGARRPSPARPDVVDRGRLAVLARRPRA